MLSDLKNSGKEIVLVTSGAIGVGAGHLGLKERPRDIGGKQAAAAVGQCELMYLYDKCFGEYGHITAQVLLTRDVVEDPDRKRNVVNTLTRLLEYGTVPIINENDTVAVDEIEFGDNDTPVRDGGGVDRGGRFGTAHRYRRTVRRRPPCTYRRPSDSGGARNRRFPARALAGGAGSKRGPAAW